MKHFLEYQTEGWLFLVVFLKIPKENSHEESLLFTVLLHMCSLLILLKTSSVSRECEYLAKHDPENHQNTTFRFPTLLTA